MKKSFICVLSAFLWQVIFISCDGCYQSSFDDSQLRAKNTIKTFDHLNEPIVIALPVYDTLYMFGNKNMDSRRQRIGDIIAVIDVESGTVFDWIYYPGAHGWSIWRLVEVSENPVRYLMSSVGKKELAMLDPTKTALSVTKTGLDDNLWAIRCHGKYAPICTAERNNDYEDFVQNYNVNLFNVETQSVDKTLPALTDTIGYISYLRSDPNGNFYFTTCLDKVFSLYKIDTKNLSINKASKEFNVVSFEDGDTEEQSDEFSVRYVSDKWVFVIRNPFGNYTHSRKLYLVNKDTLEIEDTININNDLDDHIYDIQFVNEKYYAICPAWKDNDRVVHLYEIDIDTKACKKVEKELAFDMTENVYVRGTKIYLMNSRNPSDIKYTYYDVSTGETGDVFGVSVQSILDSL